MTTHILLGGGVLCHAIRRDGGESHRRGRRTVVGQAGVVPLLRGGVVRDVVIFLQGVHDQSANT